MPTLLVFNRRGSLVCQLHRQTKELCLSYLAHLIRYMLKRGKIKEIPTLTLFFH